MGKSNSVFWRSILPLVGSVIGVGIFGLPFVFAQAGFPIAFSFLVLLAVVNTIVLVTYGDIIMNTKGSARFTGIVRKYLGLHWSWLGTLTMFGAAWGAMIAYIIIGGEFLKALFNPALGGEVFVYQIIFFVVSSVLLIGGLGFIARLETVFVTALLIMLFLIITGSLPFVDLSNLQTVNTDNWFLPFGVILFAFGGMAAIPEMADVLGKQKYLLRKAILVGVGIITVVYILFSGVIVAVTGSATSQEAILGLGEYVGNWVVVIGSIVGLFAVFTSFLILGISIIDTMVFDFKRRYLGSWMVAVTVPLIIFLLGARSFISVIGFTGSVLGGLTGMLAIYTYLKAKKHACTPKRCFQIPTWVLYGCSLVFAAGIVLTVAGV